MAGETPVRYRKLPGRAGIFVVYRARLGDDHLLAMSTSVVQDRYQRIFFRDLQSLWIFPTDRRLWTGWVMGAFAFMFGLFAWLVLPLRGGFDAFFFADFAVVAGVALTLFVRNLVLGRGCECFVRTAVQTVKLPSLNRVPRAMRARALIGERVAEAQAGFAAEAAAANLASPAAESNAAVAGAATPVAMPQVAIATPEPVPSRGKSPAVVVDRIALRAVGATGFFALIAAIGLLYDFVEPAVSGLIASMLTVLAALVAAIVHLVLGRDGKLPPRARHPAVAVFLMTVAGAFFGYVVLIATTVGATMRGRMTAQRRFDPVVALAGQPPGSSAWIDVFYYSLIAGFAAIGIWALVVFARLALKQRAPAQQNSS